MRANTPPTTGVHIRALSAWGFALFALCCAADAFVLRAVWNQHDLAPNQFRRGYFERLDGEPTVTFDQATHPSMVPTFMLGGDGGLTMPPGLIAVAPIADGIGYRAQRQDSLAPLAVIGIATPATVGRPGFPDDGQFHHGRTPAVRAGRMALVDWTADSPWREDEIRLTQLSEHCAVEGQPLAMTVRVRDDQLEIALGRCTLQEPLSPPGGGMTALGVLAGPAWISVDRTPGWQATHSIKWAVLGVIAAKVAILWWALGASSATAVSAVLFIAAFWLPVPAMLMWPVMALVSIVAAAIRAALWILARVPRRRRPPVAGAMLVAVGAFVAYNLIEPTPDYPIAASENSSTMACAVVGYSTVKGEGLRGEAGGIRSLLNAQCPACRHATAGLFAGGGTIAWARDGMCSSPTAFGENGDVIFLGGANDDYFWGRLSLPRLFVAGQLGGEAWQQNEAPAAAASYGRIDEQLSALTGLVRCARARGARFLYVHDLMVTDLRDRDVSRAAMRDRREQVVVAEGGEFIDIARAFADEMGVSWFNDYVHLSQLAQGRVAEAICDHLANRP